MSKAFYFILALAIAGGSLAITNPFDLPLVYAQVVETTGQNYDMIEDFTTGQAKWTSHPERIMVNGEWENYFLTADNQKIIFNSNSIGGFIYDIPTCSYTIYENGFDGNQIIPSVSSVATYLKDGTWQNMAVNQEECLVNVSQNENGIFLTSTKNLIQTITNGTNVNGTAITFNVETEKFVQELKVDIFGGIKETFKVWNESDEQLGISQTVHTGETIIIGENTIDIAQFNGQSFDRQFLEDNQARIFEIADGLNYDFDLGFESLTGINIISESSFFDTTYKVNLDYANGNFVNYLEIDPTLTTTGSGTFDVSPIWEHTISSGTIDGTALTSSQITALQNDLTNQNQYHTLAGTTLIVSYTVNTTPDPPTNISANAGIPIGLSWTAPVDDGGSSITGYKVYRTQNQYVMTELPNNGGTTLVDFTDNELLLHAESISSTTPDNSPNTLTVTANAGTSTTGQLNNAISAPNLSVTSSILPDATDSFTVGSWVKQTATPTNTKLFGFTNSNGDNVAFNVGTTTADFVSTTYSSSSIVTSGSWGFDYDVGSYDNNRQGFYVGSTNSALLGKTVDSVSFYLKKVGSPTGTAYVKAWSGTNTGSTVTPVNTFGTIDVSTLTTSYQKYTFNTGSHTLALYDTIGIEWTGTSSANAPYVQGNLADNYDGTNTSRNRFTGGAWTPVPAQEIRFELDYLTPTTNTIISATGLSDNTSNFQHYALTRDGSNWTIYQNGASVATATDSTNLGTVSGSHSINLDGSIDEYFIDSTALTSNEIQTVYDMATHPPQIATTGTTPSYDDSGVVGGNTYYYYVKTTNAIGDSDFSTQVSGLAGTPPNPPTGVTTSIQNPNSNPLDVFIQWSTPTNVGSGTLTGFEIVRDGSVVATVGLVTSYTDTVTSAGTYTYLVRAISTHGTSSDSNTSNITTPTEPSAINNLSATVNSDTAIALSWSSPNNGGSAITLYKVFQDAVQIDTTTNTSYTVTGLSPNTSYDFTVVASNNVGDSTASNTATQTTYLEITGHIDLTATTQGSTTQFVFSANVTAGTPTPTFSTFDIIENGITIASNISSPYNLKLTDTATHTYTIISTDNTHWNTPSINGTVSGITASYQADWQTDLLGTNEIAYNLSRANDQLNLVVNRDTGTNTWHLNCNYRTNTQILSGNNGTWYEVNSWYYDDTQNINDASIVYIDCYNDDVILQITSYSSDRTGGGIAVLNGFFEDWTGTPVALFFVLLVAGLFSGRTAPTGILLILAIVGVMAFVGLLVIDEAIWAFVLLVGILGLFVGKRFL